MAERTILLGSGKHGFRVRVWMAEDEYTVESMAIEWGREPDGEPSVVQTYYVAPTGNSYGHPNMRDRLNGAA